MNDGVEIFVAFSRPSTEAVHRLASGLDASEIARSRIFSTMEGQVQFLWRRLLRRHALAEISGLRPDMLQFENHCPRCGLTAHGKPRLSGGNDLHFSASSAGPVAAVAVGFESLGVDIENRSLRLRGMEAEILSPIERAEFSRDPRPDRLLAIWTRKEAYLKAIGVGLAIDPRQVEAGFAEDHQLSLVSCSSELSAQVRAWRLNPTTYLAVAAATVRKIRIRFSGPFDDQQGLTWTKPQPLEVRDGSHQSITRTPGPQTNEA